MPEPIDGVQLMFVSRPAVDIEGWDAISPRFLNGAPMVVDPARTVVQGESAAAVFFTEPELAANPRILGAVAVWESPRPDADRRIPLCLVTCVEKPRDAVAPFHYVLSVSPMLPAGMDLDRVAGCLTNRENLSAVLAVVRTPMVAELDLVSVAHGTAVLAAVAVAMTTGRLAVPYGDLAAAFTRVTLAAVIDGATDTFRYREALAFRPCRPTAPARVRVERLPTIVREPGGA